MSERPADRSPFTLPVALALLRNAYSSESYSLIMAAVALRALLLLIVFLAVSRRIVEDVRVSGVKGLAGPASPRVE